MRYIITLFAFICSSAFLFSQENEYNLLMNGNIISPRENSINNKSLTANNVNKQEPKLAKKFVLIQFFKIPTPDEISVLKKAGVEIKSNFFKTTYFAKINTNFYKKSKNYKNIKSVMPVKPEYKLAEGMLKGHIPSYAKEGNNAKVIISCFEINTNTITNHMQWLGIKDYRISKDFNEVMAKIPQNLLLKVAKFNWVQNIELVPPPYVIKNKPVSSSQRTNILQSTMPKVGYGLTGKGVKIGMWDTNVQKHVDCTGRLTNKDYEIESSHGSHVFGTMAGAGIIDPKAKGMAPEAEVFSWNFNTQNNGLRVYEKRLKSIKEDGIEFTQNSFGDYVRTALSTFRYSADDRGDDAVTVKKPYLLNIYAVGNDQANNAASGGFATSSKNSKNSLHVGAINKNEKISNYSSFGPTADGRIIPQVSTVGTNVYSMIYGNGYSVMSGTSMSTPGVSGVVALLYQRYKEKNNGKKPLASLIKAIVSNTAKNKENKGPDYKYGYGIVNGIRAVKAIDNKTYFINSVSNNEEKHKTITVPKGAEKLKIMLCYSDLPGVAGSSKILVNDLDLKVVKNGKEYYPWVLNPAKPNEKATKGIDKLNNIEQVTIDKPEAGTYKVIVKGSHIPLNSQEYAVTYDILMPELTLTYPIGNEKLNPKDTEYIRWDYVGEKKTFTLQYSTNSGTSYKTIASDIPADKRSYKWSVPKETTNKVKIRIIAGAKTSSSKENITIMERPSNLKSSNANSCGVNSFTMKWDAVKNAKYEILKLKNLKDFVKIAETTTNSYSFSNSIPGENNWYTVRAVDLKTKATSERAIAIKINPRTKTKLSATSLPYSEDFESLQIDQFSFSTGNKETGYAGLGYYDSEFKNAALMGGRGKAQPKKPWVKSIIDGHGFATITNAFIDNPTYIKKMEYCKIDATKLKGKKITLNFDLKYTTPTGSSNKIFFRVLVNGTELISTDKYRYYHGINGNHSPFYDLSNYAGTVFDLAFEAVIDDQIINQATEQTAILAIDNIKIAEAKNDVATIYGYSHNKKPDATSNEVPVTIRIQNFSPNTITNVPVSYSINKGTPVKEIITKKILPFNSYNYTFKTKIDLSKQGAYNISLNVNYPNDENPKNNKYQLKQIVNLGNDIVLGASPPTKGNPLYTYTTCSATFTDDGTRYGNYKSLNYGSVPKVAVFVPKENGKKIKIDFSEFELEKGYDILNVYNGPDLGSPLLAKLTGSENPKPIISTATGGELTFQLVTDFDNTAKGWVANISCVNPKIKTESKIIRITKPQIVNKKTKTTSVAIVVKNLGEKPRINLPVFYQVNGGKKIEEVISQPIAPLEEKEYVFKTTTDMSKEEGNFKYVIKAGINETDLMPQNNTTEITVYNKYALPGNVNKNGYGITQLSWDKFENKSGVSGYSDFKKKIIPVIKGKKYIPFVKVSKPEVAVGKRFNNQSSGIFTIMVIDLNNDGDFSDEFYSGNFWVNTEFTDTEHRSNKTTHYFKKALNEEMGVIIPENTPNGNHQVRFIHMFRSPFENYSVILGPTKDNINTSREDFEIEEYTLKIQDKPTADASITDVQVVPRKKNLSAVRVKVRNNSKSPISNFDIAYKLDNGAEIRQKITDKISSEETKTISFNTKVDLKTIKKYTITAYTKLANDTNPANDTKTITVNHTGNYNKNLVATFKGTDDYMASKSPGLDLTNNYTFEAWVRQTEEATADKGGGLPRIMDKNTVKVFINNGASKSYNKNSFVCYFLTEKGEYILNTKENTAIQNNWQHIALSVDKNNQYVFYINGKPATYKLVSTKNSTSIPEPAKSNANDLLYIGNQEAKNRGFIGNIDEVRVWSGVRTQKEINDNITAKLSGNESNLAIYYPINENSGEFVYDYSSSDNTATIKNSSTDGIGKGKFWNIPKLLNKIEASEQISNNFNQATSTYTIQLPKNATANNLALNYKTQMNSVVKIGTVVQENNITKNDFTNPVRITVKGVGFNSNLSETYTVKVLAGLNDKSELIRYDFLASDNTQLTKDINTTINGMNVSGSITKSISKNNLTASFTVSPKASLYIDGVKQMNGKTRQYNYENNLVITVVSENGLSKTHYDVSLKDVGARKPKKSEYFRVYPNPATEGKINIFSNFSSKSPKIIYIYTLSGNQVLYLKSSETEIDISTISSGTYIFRVAQDNIIENKTIIIKK